jgi:glycosyltransferase involved in cell wall biosynthesis
MMLQEPVQHIRLPLSEQAGWPWDEEVSHDAYGKSINWPKISIITPSFNQGHFIEETIRSVLAQNYPNLEFIIIDGGSTDETVSILKKYSDWLTYWESVPDRGQSHAINKGLKRSSGDIINWLNSDDWYLPNTLLEVALQFVNDPQVDVVSGHEYHVETKENIFLSGGTYLKSSLEETIEMCQIAQPSTFFRADKMHRVGPLSEHFHYLMDGEFWIRYLLLFGQNNFKKMSVPLVNFRLHRDSKSVSNRLVDNFLFERSSIILSLQKYVGVPDFIIEYWRDVVFQTPKVYDINTNWRTNNNTLSKSTLTYSLYRIT